MEREHVLLRVRNLRATCEILHLTLGPLDLELLGLRIRLDRVRLWIGAEEGGGVLGDLLCTLAGALRPGGGIPRIVDLLNQILRALLG